MRIGIRSLAWLLYRPVGLERLDKKAGARLSLEPRVLLRKIRHGCLSSSGMVGLRDHARMNRSTPSQISMAVRPTRKPMACSDEASPLQ